MPSFLKNIIASFSFCVLKCSASRRRFSTCEGANGFSIYPKACKSRKAYISGSSNEVIKIIGGKRQPLRRPLALADSFRRPGRSVRRGRTAERIGMELHAGESGQGAPQQRSRTFGRCSDRQYRPYADRCRRHGHLESQGPAFGSVPAAGETLRLPVHIIPQCNFLGTDGISWQQPEIHDVIFQLFISFFI